MTPRKPISPRRSLPCSGRRNRSRRPAQGWPRRESGTGRRWRPGGYSNSFANVQAGFTNMLTALGNSPQVVSLLNETAKGLNDLAAAARDNPQFMAQVVTELRRFIVDLRQFASDVQAIVSTIGGAVEGLRNVTKTVNNAADAVKNYFTVPGRGEGAGNAQPALGGGMKGFGERGRAGGFYGTPPDLTPGAPIPSDPNTRSDLRLQNFNPGTPNGAAGGTQEAALYMDGKRVGHALIPHLAAMASGPSVGAGRFDVRRGVAPVDVSVA